jgi:hypothetical protein
VKRRRPEKQLTTIVDWLKIGSDSHVQWQLHLELARGCLNESLVSLKRIGIMTELGRLARFQNPRKRIVAERQVRAMTLALEKRNRRSALAYGETASRWL